MPSSILTNPMNRGIACSSAWGPPLVGGRLTQASNEILRLRHRSPDILAAAHTGGVSVSPRPGRRTNLALLVLLAGAFVTGWLAFAVGGSPESRVVSAAHGVVGLALVVLAPWKTVIVRRGL